MGEQAMESVWRTADPELQYVYGKLLQEVFCP